MLLRLGVEEIDMRPVTPTPDGKWNPINQWNSMELQLDAGLYLLGGKHHDAMNCAPIVNYRVGMSAEKGKRYRAALYRTTDWGVGIC